MRGTSPTPASDTPAAMTSPWKVSSLTSASPKPAQASTSSVLPDGEGHNEPLSSHSLSNKSPVGSPKITKDFSSLSFLNERSNDLGEEREELHSPFQENNGDSYLDLFNDISPTSESRAVVSSSPRHLLNNSCTFSRDDVDHNSPKKQEESTNRKEGNGFAIPKRSFFSGKRQLFEEDTLEKRVMTLETTINRMNINLIEISKKFDITLMNLGRIQRVLNPGQKRLTIPKNMPKLPLTSKAHLNTFETFLGDSDIHLAAAVDYMSNFIVKTSAEPEKKSATSVLSKLLTNNLAKEMNLDGGYSKVAFRALNLNKVFEATLQEAFPESDLGEAKAALRSWLKDAKWRKQASTASPSPSTSKGARPSTSKGG